jgi:hypothetical protein
MRCNALAQETLTKLTITRKIMQSAFNVLAYLLVYPVNVDVKTGLLDIVDNKYNDINNSCDILNHRARITHFASAEETFLLSAKNRNRWADVCYRLLQRSSSKTLSATTLFPSLGRHQIVNDYESRVPQTIILKSQMQSFAIWWHKQFVESSVNFDLGILAKMKWHFRYMTMSCSLHPAITSNWI